MIIEQKDENDELKYSIKFRFGDRYENNIDNSTVIVTKLGCGFADCSLKGMVPSFFMDCTYITGNIIGHETYEVEPKTITSGLSQEQKDVLINLHRQARAAVNASNMKELNWDDELADIAQVIFF